MKVHLTWTRLSAIIQRHEDEIATSSVEGSLMYDGSMSRSADVSQIRRGGSYRVIIPTHRALSFALLR